MVEKNSGAMHIFPENFFSCLAMGLWGCMIMPKQRSYISYVVMVIGASLPKDHNNVKLNHYTRFCKGKFLPSYTLHMLL
jgi:hypothetical protein